ncbi:HAD family hydrolase [Undibacterium sp. Di27W]
MSTLYPPMNSPYQLIIFDCDGVLVDSERITNEVFVKMLNELGLPLKLEDMFEQFVGHSMEQCMAKIADMLGHQPPENFLAEYRVRTRAVLESKLVVVPGIPEALAQLKLPYCVASSGDHEKMRTTLGVTGLWPQFEGRIFSVSDVKAPKPAPDVFLHAAATMGFAPEDCVVVEDTPTGVRAAVAAGMTVLAYAALTPAQRLREAGAHIIFDNMLDLPVLISKGKLLTATA